MEKHSVKMSLALPARPGVARQPRLRIVLIDGSEGDAATIQWLCLMELRVYTLFVYNMNKHRPMCDYTACIWSYYMQFSCFPLWVAEFVYRWLGKCHSGWEYKLGQHIKSMCVMLEQLYSGHRSLTELPSISACLQWHMPSLPSIWKAFSMSLTLSQRETSIFSSPSGYATCQKHKRRKLRLHCFRRLCVWFWYSVVCIICRKLTYFKWFSLLASRLCMCAARAVGVGWRITEAEIDWA